MFTVFHLIQVLTVVSCVVIGAFRGAVQFEGIFGVILGSIIGYVFGMIVGYLPIMIGKLVVELWFRLKSTQQVRDFLKGPVWSSYHLAFSELARRRADLLPELGVVIDLLQHEDPVRRIHGSIIIHRFFSKLPSIMLVYKADGNLENCNQMAEVINTILQKSGRHCHSKIDP